MDIQTAKDIFNSLYGEVDGHKLSKSARQKQPYYYIAETYGEVLFESFYDILRLANPKKGGVFYDLGSGTGKPSLIAYLCFNFSKVVGIEKMPDLHFASKKIIEKLKENNQDLFNKEKSNTVIDFYLNDFQNEDFSDADIIFMNSYSYFYYEINNKNFIDKLITLKKDSRIITTAIPIFLDIFKVDKKGPFNFSWGPEYIYLHQKIN